MAKFQVNKQKQKTPMPELDVQERIRTFDEVSLGYSADDAINEAHRCIQCPKAFCSEGCPVGVPIPQFVERVAGGDFAAAYAMVKSANALPAICGRVCPQERQCEGRCARGRNGEPVGIGRLERFVADWAFEHPEEASLAVASLSASSSGEARDPDVPEGAAGLHGGAGDAVSAEAGSKGCASTGPRPTGIDLTGRRVSVVGSGPASLTCAGELAKRGCEVKVFEALHRVGGVLTYGIPEFRLPKDLVAREVSALGEIGVSFDTNVLVGRLYDVVELMEEHGFEAVFVGTGAGLPRYLGIEGEGLNGVMAASELLTRVNLMKAYRFPEYETPVYAGNRCVVVGGGNVAMDAARTARRLGAEVTVVYRRGRDEMPARAEEIHHAEQEGVAFQFLTNPLRAVGDDRGWIVGLECELMELGEPDATGRRSPVPVAGSEFVMDTDMLVIAIGSKSNPLIAQTTPDLEVSARNLIVADERTGATSRPGVFAGGDAVLGAATVIRAMGAGKRAAAGIAEYLTGDQSRSSGC